MSTELIDYKNKGFQISDIYMQLVLYYINEELKKNQYIFTNKGYLQRYHESIINGNMAGWFAFLWDEKLSNSSDEQTMLQVLENVKITLQNKGSFISVAELQTIPTEDKDFKRFYGRYPFPTSELIKVIDALIQMLQGTWESTNYNMDINY